MRVAVSLAARTGVRYQNQNSALAKTTRFQWKTKGRVAPLISPTSPPSRMREATAPEGSRPPDGGVFPLLAQRVTAAVEGQTSRHHQALRSRTRSRTESLPADAACCSSQEAR